MAHPYASKTPGRAAAHKRYASGGSIDAISGNPTKNPNAKTLKEIPGAAPSAYRAPQRDRVDANSISGYGPARTRPKLSDETMDPNEYKKGGKV